MCGDKTGAEKIKITLPDDKYNLPYCTFRNRAKYDCLPKNKSVKLSLSVNSRLIFKVITKK